MKLIGYFRSSAAFRVRIALNLKGITVEHASRHLRKGEQAAPDYVALNPQKLVPALVLDSGEVLTQSLAILEYLEETHPEPPLLPKDPVGRARVRALALIPTADIHPIQNLRVMAYLREKFEPDRGERLRLVAPLDRDRLRCLRGLDCAATARPAPSATATSRPWPISAWCRRSSTPRASRSTWRGIRPSSASTPPA